ncbi:MAG: hypothetical protein WBF53_02380 [Litorimonas sp.]
MDESTLPPVCSTEPQAVSEQEITARFRERAKRQIAQARTPLKSGDRSKSQSQPLPALEGRSGLSLNVSDFDVSAFLHHFEGMELTEAEEHEVLHALWEIMCRFVEVGFGLDAYTLAKQSTGACGKLVADAADESASVVN